MSLIEKHGNTELSFLTQVVKAIFKDCYATYRTDIQLHIWRKDFNQFSKYVRTRGLGYLCLDLPELDSILLNGIESGKVGFTRPMFGRGHIPSFLKGLWYRIFDENGDLLNDADPTAIFFIRQIANVGKKANITRDTTRINKEKEIGFFDTEKDLRTPTKRWRVDDIYGPSVIDVSLADIHNPLGFWATGIDCASEDIGDSRKLTYVQEVCDFFFAGFESIETDRVAKFVDSCGNFRMKHGPGATHNTSRFTDKWAAREIDSNLTYLMDRFPEINLAFENCMVTPIQPNRLIFVPKDMKGPRLIAAEPIMNQYFQQGIFKYIKSAMRHNGMSKFVDFSNQEESRKMACHGSIDRSLATIDLKDASDRLSLWLFERVFRQCPTFVNYCMSCRSSHSIIGENKPIEVRKYATQGNATTFPVQSIVYLSLVIGTILYEQRKPINASSVNSLVGKVRTFGDDIIVPNEYYSHVCQTLTSLGLRVNATKSFHRGFFRESCGGDFYKGYNVTPIKIRRVDMDDAESQQMLIDVSNDAYRSGLWHLSAFLLEQFRVRSASGEYPLVPMRNAVISGGGMYTHGKIRNSHLKSRWNSKMHTIELKQFALVNKTWKVYRTPLSRAREQQLSDVSRPGWSPERIQRSQSSMKIGWL